MPPACDLVTVGARCPAGGTCLNPRKRVRRDAARRARKPAPATRKRDLRRGPPARFAGRVVSPRIGGSKISDSTVVNTETTVPDYVTTPSPSIYRSYETIPHKRKAPIKSHQEISSVLQVHVGLGVTSNNNATSYRTRSSNLDLAFHVTAFVAPNTLRRPAEARL